MVSLTDLVSTQTNEGDVVGGKATGFATVAGFAAATTGIGGAAIAVVQQITESNIDPALRAAALGLVGLGALAWAIASAGDVLARAYASAHVVPAIEAGAEPTPVLKWALTPEANKLAPMVAVLQAATSNAAPAQTADADGTHQIMPLPAATKVSYRGSVVTALAVRTNTTDSVSILVAGAGESPQWVDASATALHE